MGYLTHFKLHAVPHSYPVAVIGEAMEEASKGYWDAESIQYLIDGDMDSCKWYSFDGDMIALSKLLPDVLFKLSGTGEEQGDEWVHFYLNGEVEKHQRENWVPPNFPSKNIEWNKEKREKAVASQQEHYDRIKRIQDERLAKREQDKREKAAAEIQAIAEKAGIEAVVKGVTN